MPTDRKNRPSRMPRNGSTSASSWWRNVDSESSTPARNAPMRHRQPAPLHEQRRAEHHQQRRRGHHLATAEAGQDAEQRVQRPSDRPPPARRAPRVPCSTDSHARTRRLDRRALREPEERHQREQRDDRQVLEQQDRHRALAGGVAVVAALVEHLHDHGGRGQHETHRADHRDRRRPAEGDADAGQQRAAGEHLRDAEPEDLAAHRPQLARPHLEADEEQEQHHAELGDVQDGVRVAEQAEAERPDQQAGAEVAEHRAEPELAEQRHGDHGRREQHDDVAEVEGGFSGQLAAPAPAEGPAAGASLAHAVRRASDVRTGCRRRTRRATTTAPGRCPARPAPRRPAARPATRCPCRRPRGRRASASRWR